MQRARFYSAFVLIRGGNANNGANAGPLYGNWNNTASNSNWNYGARPTLLMLDYMKYQRLYRLRKAQYGLTAILTPW